MGHCIRHTSGSKRRYQALKMDTQLSNIKSTVAQMDADIKRIKREGQCKQESKKKRKRKKIKSNSDSNSKHKS